jgi:Mg/Co/Ni transporter MgtE
MRERLHPRESRRRWVKEYVVGLGLGAALAVYGLIAFWTKHTFLPGLKGGNLTVSGLHGAGLAAAYVSGGLYLVCRLFVQRRCRSAAAQGQVYLIENVLLVVLIASLAYVLWQVGTVG